MASDVETPLRPDLRPDIDGSGDSPVKPLAQMYFQSRLVDSVLAALQRMREVAEAHGLEVDGGYVVDHSNGTAFNELMAMLSRSQARAVIVPTSTHLTAAQRRMLRDARVTVWAAEPSPLCWPGHIPAPAPSPKSRSGSRMAVSIRDEHQRRVDQDIATYRSSRTHTTTEGC